MSRSGGVSAKQLSHRPSKEGRNPDAPRAEDLPSKVLHSYSVLFHSDGVPLILSSIPYFLQMFADIRRLGTDELQEIRIKKLGNQSKILEV